MRLGVTLRAPSGPVEAIEMALQAEDAGFETIYVPERHFDSADGFANPFAIAAAISGRLQRARLGVVPAIGMEHPLRVVEQANMLDLLTRGRSVIVLSEALEPRQYASFGLPVPRNGLFENLLQHMEDAWSWDYQEDGPPLAFRGGAYVTRMAGRIMPAAKPRRALETDSEVAVRDAARRGWAVHLRTRDLQHARRLMAVYREALDASVHSAQSAAECLDWLALVVRETSAGSFRDFEALGVTEVRFDLPPETPLADTLRMARV